MTNGGVGQGHLNHPANGRRPLQAHCPTGYLDYTKEPTLPLATKGPPMATFHTYLDKANEWRWHLKADNYKIIADSGEGYSTLTKAREAAQRVKDLAPGATID